MSLWVMSEICSEYDIVGKALLKDHKLDFRRYSTGWRGGVADVVYSPGDVVWGALYVMGKKCHDALDEKENYGVGYTSMGIDVVLDNGDTMHTITYTIIEKSPQTIEPSRYYLETIIEGAKGMKLPADYIKHLKNIKTNKSI